MKTIKCYTVNKTTNTVNGMVYIGVHATDNTSDRYLDYGRGLKKAIEEFGK